MNTKNQKEVSEGFKNRIDQLGEDRATQARREALAAMTGPELMDHIDRLKWWNEETYKHIHGDSLETMLEEQAAFDSQPSTLNR